MKIISFQVRFLGDRKAFVDVRDPSADGPNEILLSSVVSQSRGGSFTSWLWHGQEVQHCSIMTKCLMFSPRMMKSPFLAPVIGTAQLIRLTSIQEKGCSHTGLGLSGSWSGI